MTFDPFAQPPPLPGQQPTQGGLALGPNALAGLVNTLVNMLRGQSQIVTALNALVNISVTRAVATATAGAATLNGTRGIVTSESLTTAAGSDYVLTVTNSQITASSIVLVSVANGTNTTEGMAVNRVQPASGSAVVHVRNTGSGVWNGTIVISFAVL